ncbi:MAG: cation acetate symporter, partial [Burkholderiales bacterium]
KFTLLAVAMIAAAVAALKPADILALVAASFSLSAAAFVPTLLLGILWRGTSRRGAVAGMLAGFGVTAWYILINAAGVRSFLALPPQPQLWLGIQPVSAGVFGVAVGFLVTWCVSLLERRNQGVHASF